jgi:integrase
MKIKVKDAVQQWLGHLRSTQAENTYITYEIAIRLFNEMFGEMQVNELGFTQLTDYMAQLRDYAPSTESIKTSAVMNFYEWCVASGASIDIERARAIRKRMSRKVPEQIPDFNMEDVEAVIDYVLSRPDSIEMTTRQRMVLARDKAIFAILAHAGLRVSEIAALKVYDYEDGHLILRTQKNLRRNERVPLSGTAQENLNKYLVLRDLWTGETGQHLPLISGHARRQSREISSMSSQSLYDLVKRWTIEAIGEERAEGISPHTFRHRFVTRVLQKTGDLVITQKAARHRSPKVTLRYVHLADDEVSQAILEAVE